MTSRAVLPAFRTIALWAFALNSAWEFAQCPIFYEMSDLPLAASVLWMAGAILGDVVIVLSLVVFARHVSACIPTSARYVALWAILLAISLPAGVILEWLPRARERWTYSDRMPTVSLAGTGVGLVPIAQVALLPAATLLLASRTTSRRGRPQR